MTPGRLSLVFCCATLASAAEAAAGAPQRPEVVVSAGHGGHVMQAAASSDGTFIVTSGDDNTLRIWSLDSLQEIRSLPEPELIFDFALSPDTRWIAAAVGNQVSIWDVDTGVRRMSLGGGDRASITALAISPDGRLVATATSANAIELWDVESRAVVRELRTSAELICLAFSPDGTRLAGGGVKELGIWTTASTAAPTLLVGHTAGVHAVAFSPDGRLLASGSWDGTIRLWNPATGAATRTIPGAGAVTSLAFSHAGDTLAAGTTLPNLSLWNVATGAHLRTMTVENAPATRDLDLETKTDAYPRVGQQYAAFTVLADAAPEGGRSSQPRGGYRSSVIFTSDDAVVISTIDPLFARVWLTRSGRPGVVFWGLNARNEGTIFSADRRWLLRSNGRGAALWDLTSGTQVRLIDGRVTPLALDPQGRLMATVEDNGHQVVLRDTESGKETARVPTRIDEDNTGPGAAHVAIVTLSKDFRWLASASGPGARRVKIWTVPDAKRVLDLAAHDSFVNNLVFSPDGTLLLSTGNDGAMHVWDTQTGTRVRSFEVATYISPEFSADGRYVAFVDDANVLHAVDSKSGARLLEQKLDRVDRVAWHPSGKALAVKAQSSIVLIDTTSGRTIKAIAHAGGTADMMFTPDGRWLATADRDGVLRFWDPDTASLALALVGMGRNPDTYEEDTSWLVVTPDGQFDGPPDAWRRVSLRFNGQTFDLSPVEIGFKTYFAPGLLADVLSGRAAKVAEDISRIDRRQVAVAFVDSTPRTDAPVASRRITLRLQVTQAAADQRHRSGSGARDLRLFRNGALVKRWRGDLPLGAAGSTTLQAEVPLVAGENRFVAYAFSSADIKSRDASVTVTGADSLRRPATAYVVAVGVNRYARPGLDLRYAVADAREFSAQVSSQLSSRKDFGSVRVIPLLDADATSANIRAVFARLAGRTVALSDAQRTLIGDLAPASPEDTVFIYFAGHGVAVDGRFYLLPHDFALSADGATIDAARAVSEQELSSLVEVMDVARIVLVIDACQSGQVLESEEKRRGPMNSKGFAQLAYEKGMYILTASQAYQAALEVSQLGHGLLTYALVEEGLKSPAAARGGQVDLRSWLDFATVRVPELQSALEAKKAPGRALSRAGDTALQRPRVFYRREPDSRPLILAIF